MSNNYAVDPSYRQLNALIQTLGLLLFSLLLVLWAYCVLEVLIRQKKYRHAPMLMFYLMSFLLLTAALTEYSLGFSVLFPNRYQIIVVELRAVSYIAVGVCLECSLCEVICAFRGNMTRKMQSCFKMSCIITCASMIFGWFISVMVIFSSGE
jgi:hypothetical protein